MTIDERVRILVVEDHDKHPKGECSALAGLGDQANLTPFLIGLFAIASAIVSDWEEAKSANEAFNLGRDAWMRSAMKEQQEKERAN